MDSAAVLKSLKNKKRDISFITEDRKLLPELVPLIRHLPNAEAVWKDIFVDDRVNIWYDSKNFELLTLDMLPILIRIFNKPDRVATTILNLHKQGHDLYHLHDYLVNVFYTMSITKNRLTLLKAMRAISNLINGQTVQRRIRDQLLACFKCQTAN